MKSIKSIMTAAFLAGALLVSAIGLAACTDTNTLSSPTPRALNESVSLGDVSFTVNPVIKTFVSGSTFDGAVVESFHKIWVIAVTVKNNGASAVTAGDTVKFELINSIDSASATSPSVDVAAPIANLYKAPVSVAAGAETTFTFVFNASLSVTPLVKATANGKTEYVSTEGYTAPEIDARTTVIAGLTVNVTLLQSRLQVGSVATWGGNFVLLKMTVTNTTAAQLDIADYKFTFAKVIGGASTSISYADDFRCEFLAAEGIGMVLSANSTVIGVGLSANRYIAAGFSKVFLLLYNDELTGSSELGAANNLTVTAAYDYITLKLGAVAFND